MTFNNLCNSCTNIGCEFQSGIVRTKCAFYMPPHIEPDNCGNYVVMQPTFNVLGKIISEATSLKISYTDHDKDTYRRGVNDVVKIIDKYKAESGGKE